MPAISRESVHARTESSDAGRGKAPEGRSNRLMIAGAATAMVILSMVGTAGYSYGYAAVAASAGAAAADGGAPDLTESLYRQRHVGGVLGRQSNPVCSLPPDSGVFAHMCDSTELAHLQQLASSSHCGLGDTIAAWSAGVFEESQKDEFCACVVSIGFEFFKGIGCRLSPNMTNPVSAMASQCVPNTPCKWFMPEHANWKLVNGDVEYAGGVVSQNFYDSDYDSSETSCDSLLHTEIDGLQEFTCDGVPPAAQIPIPFALCFHRSVNLLGNMLMQDFCPECTTHPHFCDASCHYCEPASPTESDCMTSVLTSYWELKTQCFDGGYFDSSKCGSVEFTP